MYGLWIGLGIVCFILFSFLFMIFPSFKSKRFELPKYIAHRGLHDEKVPENSLLSFENAIKENFAIENDIHILKDGSVVVFHDDDLKRMCGVERNISDMTLEEIKELRLLQTDQEIPTLKECLELVDGKVPLVIEFKANSTEEANRLCQAADKILSEYKGEYYMQSFYPVAVQWYKKNRPDVIRGQLSSAFKKGKTSYKMLGMLLFNFLGRPDFISYEYVYEKNFFRRFCCNVLGAYPIAWTFKEQKQIDDSREFKGFIFEGFIPKR